MDLGQLATVEVTSEDRNFPIESVFAANGGPGWRASQKGEQQIRLIFDRGLAPGNEVVFDARREPDSPAGIHRSVVNGGRRAARRDRAAAVEFQSCGLDKRARRLSS
jgi:hypothetical protein